MKDRLLFQQKSDLLKTSIKEITSSPELINVCVASKYATNDQIHGLYEIGYRTFGENKIQDGLQKIKSLDHLKDIKWHFIGHLQKNKVRKAVEHFDCIQSVDSLSLLEKINTASIFFNKISTCFLQVNSGNDPKKFGFSIEKVLELKEKLFSFSNIDIQGIMILAPQLNDKSLLIDIFNDSFKLFIQLKKEFNINYISMGMSQDYKLAIQSGSNMIRIGRMLFQNNS